MVKHRVAILVSLRIFVRKRVFQVTVNFRVYNMRFAQGLRPVLRRLARTALRTYLVQGVRVASAKQCTCTGRQLPGTYHSSSVVVPYCCAQQSTVPADPAAETPAPPRTPTQQRQQHQHNNDNNNNNNILPVLAVIAVVVRHSYYGGQ